MTIISTDQFLEAAAHRRSVYALKGSSAISDERIQQILKKIQSFSPSSHNTQPVRVSLVTGEKHKKLWDIIISETGAVLKNVGTWDTVSPLFQHFKASYGSVFFWESGDAIKESQESHKHSACMFPQYSEHANGMFQLLVWSALELEGLGANLQHMHAYGPNVEGAIKKFVGVPDSYNLKANLNFGDEAQPHPMPKVKLPFEDVFTYVQ